MDYLKKRKTCNKNDDILVEHVLFEILQSNLTI